MKSIKKYIAIIRIGIKNQSVYRFNLFVSSIFPLFKVCLYFLIWSAIYDNKDVYSGISFNMMITYYIIVSFFSSLSTSENVARSIANEIKNGEFSKYLIRPIKLRSFYFSSCISSILVNIVINILSLTVSILFFLDYFIIPYTLQDVIVCIPLFFLGIFWLIQSDFLIALMALWLDEVYAFFHIKRTTFGFLIGEIVPLSLFPTPFLIISKILPFYYIYNYPIEVYMGKGDSNIFIAYFCLIIWNFIFYIINNLVYKKAIKSYSGVGI